MNLIFVGDPMCSWCYGFGKELATVLETTPDLSLDIVLGGLRAGGTDVLDAAGKQFRLTHWARVEAASGVPFNREALLSREGFVYDTEPVCRAVVTARILAPRANLLGVFRALQHAFYVDGLDTTDAATLARVTADALTAAGHPVHAGDVLQQFNAKSTVQAAREDFRKTREWGISSFPALLAEVEGDVHVVTPGFLKAAGIQAAIQTLRENRAAAQAR